ncbi:hypothetical protein [Lunatibacter salilacus]|uniref:hypothetical protein n=1 Tax=Lunatibacter salilacus TaxID=2483804 RepID=UPI00131B3D1A|nr:hypothetical protein [Lunatibacter salilacus]
MRFYFIAFFFFMGFVELIYLVVGIQLRSCPTPALPPVTATLSQDFQLKGRELDSVK